MKSNAEFGSLDSSLEGHTSIAKYIHERKVSGINSRAVTRTQKVYSNRQGGSALACQQFRVLAGGIYTDAQSQCHQLHTGVSLGTHPTGARILASDRHYHP
jgi:hypothetical protein